MTDSIPTTPPEPGKRAHDAWCLASGMFPDWGEAGPSERAAWSAVEAERRAGMELVKDAYNEGFVQGMREHTSSRGGIPWSESAIRARIGESAT